MTARGVDAGRRLGCALLWTLVAACGNAPASPVGPDAEEADVAESVTIKPLQLYIDSLGVTRQAAARAYAELDRFLYNSLTRPDAFTWSSSAPSVLTVDSTGLVSSLAWGAATVTATHESGLTGTMSVTVRDAVDLAWSVWAGSGSMQSSVVIGVDGTIYAGTHRPEEDASTWSAVSPAGDVLWTLLLPITELSTPAVGSDGTLYVGSRVGAVDSMGRVIAIDPSGTVRWVQEDVTKIRSSPALGADGTIYAAGRQFLYAIDPDGDIAWAYEADNNAFVYSSPAVADDGTIYLGGYDDLLYAIAEDGTPKWTFSAQNLIQSSPAIASDGTVYFGSEDGHLYAVAPHGAQRWRLDLDPGGVASSPSIGPDGTIYVIAGDLFAIDPAGTIRWRYAAASHGFQPTPVVAGDGSIYFGSFRGITALDADGGLKWHYRLDDATLGSPAIGVDGTIVMASFAVDVATRTSTGTIRAFVENGTDNGGHGSASWPTARGGRANTGRVGG